MGQSGLSRPVSSVHVEQYLHPEYEIVQASMWGFRREMEDAHCIHVDVNNQRGCFLGVFDGHGGTEAAEFCAERACGYLFPPSLSAASSETVEQRLIQDRMLQLDADYLKTGASDGCTAVCAHVAPDATANGTDKWTVRIINLGDSRALLLSPKPKPSFVSLSIPHGPLLESEHRRIVAAGGRVANGRVDGNLAVTRTIGDAYFKVNLNFHQTQTHPEPNPREFKVTAEPDVSNPVALQPGDVLLLACDGVFEKSTPDHVAWTLQQALWEQHLPLDRALIALLRDSLERDSRDNMTAIALVLRDDVKTAQPEKKNDSNNNKNLVVFKRKLALELGDLVEFHRVIESGQPTDFAACFAKDLLRSNLSPTQIGHVVLRTVESAAAANSGKLVPNAKKHPSMPAQVSNQDLDALRELADWFANSEPEDVSAILSAIANPSSSNGQD